ncbi:NADH-quinone oxidoreductase subunit NuoN [Gordonia aurantiaca]|uniref:NADH-quinone oxidoreductase subunit NuoN n=1 Tax=Gordonia sp. B21 TaxID=3151852 RepID=UPI0032631060
MSSVLALTSTSTTPSTLAAIEAPSVEYGALSPMLIVFGAAVIGVLVEAFAPRHLRYPIQLGLSLGGLVVALGALLAVAVAETENGANGQLTMSGAVVMDRVTLYLQGLVLIIGVIAVGFMGERRLERVVAPVSLRRLATAPVGDDRSGRTGSGGVDADMFTPSGASVPNTDAEFEATRAGAVTTEVFPLALLAVGGMMLFPACGDLLTMFIALEVFSLPLYLLCGLARRRRLISQEASLKYFLLGAFSSAFFLFGSAFVYGATGSLNLATIGASINEVAGLGGDTTLALIGLAMLAVGLLFKVGAVPFHSWIPDVYQGAPTPVTAFMASATKVAAFGALLRVFYVGFGGLKDQWEPALWAVAIASMVIASVMAVTQNDVKRMLAYSSIAHAGFILLGLIAFDDAGLGATLFYLAAYAFTTLGAFAMVAVIREPDTDTNVSAHGPAILGASAPVRNPHLSGREATDLTQWSGLGRRSPLVGTMFAVYLLSFAGIPLTSGFIAKFDVFAAAAGNGGGVLVVIGVISSAIAAYVYIRIIVAMFFDDVPVDGAPHVVKPSILTMTGVAICTLLTVVLGVFPQPVLDLADAAAAFLR